MRPQITAGRTPWPVDIDYQHKRLYFDEMDITDYWPDDTADTDHATTSQAEMITSDFSKIG
jgi:hypothetical protein